jgi:tRNA G18 (ribose-2'-O)-methylase SpoU
MGAVRIERLDDPRIDDYRGVSDGELMRRRNLFVAEGRLVVGRLFESGHRVISVLVNEASHRALADSLALLPADTEVFVCSTGAFASVTGFNLHRGCLALAERPAARPLADVVDGCDRVLILDGVSDADNVGGAFRNAAAFGAHVLLGPTCCDPLYRKAIRTSMGTVLRTPYARFDDLAEGLAALKAVGFTVIALTPREPALDLSSCPAYQRVAILVGSEGSGLSDSAERFADRHVRIPMQSGIDSLNLATAAGIALYHLASGAGGPQALNKAEQA